MALEEETVQTTVDALRVPKPPLQDILDKRSTYVASTVAGMFLEQGSRVATWAGTMGGNKTETLAKVVDSLKVNNFPFIIFKLQGDARNGTDASQIFRRSGPPIAGDFIVPINHISEAVEVASHRLNGHGAVLLNEGQFMGDPVQLADAVDAFTANGYSVGGDFLGAWYDGTAVASTQAVVKKSHRFFSMQGWDSVDPNRLADFTMRGVAITQAGQVLHSEDTFYTSLPVETRQQLVQAFLESRFAEVFSLNNPDGTGFEGTAVLLPSPFHEPNFAIGADRYVPLSERNFGEVYAMAGMNLSKMPPTISNLYVGDNVVQWDQVQL